MSASERRQAILKVLCRRRFDTIANLALEFGVSDRTLRRDIEILSTNEPIYTQTGRYGGGVYVMEDYRPGKLYLLDSETETLKKVLNCLEQGNISSLEKEDLIALQRVILNYQKPYISR